MSSPTVTETELLAEIGRLETARGTEPDPELERRALRLRHRLGALRVAGAGDRAARAEPAFDRLPDASAIPEVTLAELSPELVRAALLRHGSLIVRGALEADRASRLVEGIDHALAARDRGECPRDGLYEEFEPDPPFTLIERGWVSSTGSIWTADSPRLMFEVVELLKRTGLDRVAAGYLGEPPTLSVNKSVLRKVGPDAGAGWHQDGAFLGDVEALNAWVSLSRCGDVAPGIDIVARRVDEIVPTGTEDATFDWSVSRAAAERAAGEAGIARPIFDPGDMLLFDDRCLHATAVSPEMTETRYAVETWFFAPSAFPGEYAPVGI